MTLKPCLECGEPSAESRCPDHRLDAHRQTAHQRGYNSRWRRLSKRARELQKFCSDCGAVDNLQADHSPEAWRRHNAGKPIRLQDIDVVCGPCNRTRGAARGTTKPLTRGDRVTVSGPKPEGKAQGRMNLTTDVGT